MLTRVRFIRFPSMELSVPRCPTSSWILNTKWIHWKYHATSKFLNYLHSFICIHAHLLPITVISSCLLPQIEKGKNNKENRFVKREGISQTMQSLNLKAFTDFNSLSLPSRLRGSAVKDCNWRLNRIVSCSSTSGQGSGPVQDSKQSSVFSRTETYALLKQQLEVAAKSEVSYLTQFVSMYLLYCVAFEDIWSSLIFAVI